MSVNVARQMINAIHRALIYHPQFKEIHYVLSGGEPLMNLPVIKEILNYSQEKIGNSGIKKSIGLITNGTLISPQIISLIKRQNIKISISLDGLSNTTPRVFKNGRPSTPIVLKNINQLLNSGIHPHILVTITPENIKEILDLTQSLVERDLSFRYALYRDIHHGDYIKNKKVQMELLSTLHKCYDLMEKIGYNERKPIINSFETISLRQPRTRSCGIGRNSMCVAHNGNIYLCQSDINIRLPIGSIYDKGILNSLWSQKIFTDLQINRGVENYKFCKVCKWKFLCGGGCPLLTKLTKGKLNTKSPYCKFFKQIIPRLIRIKALNLINSFIVKTYSKS